jgi:hypothetical protein
MVFNPGPAQSVTIDLSPLLGATTAHEGGGSGRFARVLGGEEGGEAVAAPTVPFDMFDPKNATGPPHFLLAGMSCCTFWQASTLEPGDRHFRDSDNDKMAVIGYGSECVLRVCMIQCMQVHRLRRCGRLRWAQAA